MTVETPEEVAFLMAMCYAYAAWVKGDAAEGDNAFHAAMSANVAMGDERMKAFFSRVIGTYQTVVEEAFREQDGSDVAGD